MQSIGTSLLASLPCAVNHSMPCFGSLSPVSILSCCYDPSRWVHRGLCSLLILILGLLWSAWHLRTTRLPNETQQFLYTFSYHNTGIVCSVRVQSPHLHAAVNYCSNTILTTWLFLRNLQFLPTKLPMPILWIISVLSVIEVSPLSPMARHKGIRSLAFPHGPINVSLLFFYQSASLVLTSFKLEKVLMSSHNLPHHMAPCAQFFRFWFLGFPKCHSFFLTKKYSSKQKPDFWKYDFDSLF